MHDVIFSKAIMFVILEVNYVAPSVDEATIVDHTSIYVMQNWKCVPILLMLERVKVGANSNNINDVIVDAMGICGGLTNFDMASKDLPWM